MSDTSIEEIAIIGMSGAFPGAGNIEAFWHNLLDAKESITTLDGITSNSQFGASPHDRDPDFVARIGLLDKAKWFDHDFFGMRPKEAEITDPQHRLLLEHAWLALEDAGYIAGEIDVPVGVFAGASVNPHNGAQPRNESGQPAADFKTMLANEKDFLTTRISYKLNLRGPSMDVQSACSTSLLAVALACQSLLNYGCDMALAGGVTVAGALRHGYRYQEGMIFSKSGVCRPFDDRADGTIFGEGVGVVCLKRLSEAVASRDHIYAVIKAVGVNNDGSEKIGFTAPGIQGQSDVIQLAQAMADVGAADIGFVETHGTGTQLGDSVEIAALKGAFNNQEPPVDTACYIGALKANIGHLDAAAGIASLIKTALVVKEGRIPPVLNYQTSNPKLGLDASPFQINTQTVTWPQAAKPRIAGVSCFGIGGTNVHAIVAAPPPRSKTPPPVRSEIFPLSARSLEGLNAYRDNLRRHISGNRTASLTDIAWTLREGRKAFEHRACVAAGSIPELLEKLGGDAGPVKTPAQKIVFLFPGQGAQFTGMAASLYGRRPVFTRWIDNGTALAQPYCEAALIDLLLKEDSPASINDTRVAQPLLFITEYALARELTAIGVKPDALLGHSSGEYVAACLAGVFSYEDALTLVCKRAQIMHRAPEGGMLAVATAPARLASFMGPALHIAAINAADQCVVAGKLDDLRILAGKLKKEHVDCWHLNVDRAFHAPLMSAAVHDFTAALEPIRFGTPEIPIVSNVTGEILPDEIDWKAHWKQHLTAPVLFDACLRSVATDATYFIEVGPGSSLTAVVRQTPARPSCESYPVMLPDPQNRQDPFENTVMAMWEAGVALNWRVWSDKPGYRVSLPGYPFVKQRFDLITQNNATPAPSRERPADDRPATHGVEKDRHATERIAKIWEAFFGIENIAPTQDFFSLGGDSLMGVELVDLMNDKLGLKLSFRELFLHPTINELTDYLHQKTPVTASHDFSILFPVQPKGAKPPLFLVAGAHGNRYFDPENMQSSYEEDFLSYFSSLVRHLGMDQPVYGFRPKGLVYGEQPHADVVEMATAYVQELKKKQPHGPYYIGGECIGGIVAYEMARQLRQAGEMVAQLILMDTPKPSFSVQNREVFLYLLRKARIGKHQLVASLKQFDAQTWREGVKRWTGIFLSILCPITRKQRNIRNAYTGSLQYRSKLLKYRPKRGYQGKVTLILNEQWHRDNFLLGWGRELGRNINVRIVPGGHLERIKVYGHISGTILREVISRPLTETYDQPAFKN